MPPDSQQNSQGIEAGLLAIAQAFQNDRSQQTDANGYTIFRIGGKRVFYKKVVGNGGSVAPNSRIVTTVTAPVGISASAADLVIGLAQFSSFSGHMSASWEPGGNDMIWNMTSIYSGGALSATPTYHVFLIAS